MSITSQSAERGARSELSRARALGRDFNLASPKRAASGRVAAATGPVVAELDRSASCQSGRRRTTRRPIPCRSIRQRGCIARQSPATWLVNTVFHDLGLSAAGCSPSGSVWGPSTPGGNLGAGSAGAQPSRRASS